MVIPAGMEFHHIVPADGGMDSKTEANEDENSSDRPIWGEITILTLEGDESSHTAVGRSISRSKSLKHIHPQSNYLCATLIEGYNSLNSTTTVHVRITRWSPSVCLKRRPFIEWNCMCCLHYCMENESRHSYLIHRPHFQKVWEPHF